MKWIKVKKRLPESDTFVLVFLSPGTITLSYYFKDSYGKWFSDQWNVWNKEYTKYVTHWMPLPKKPHERRKNGKP